MFALESQCYSETTQNRQLYAHILGEGPPNFGKGGATSFWSGDTNVAASEASRKIWGVVPHIWYSGGTAAAKRAYRRAFPWNMLATIFLTGDAFI